MSQFSRNPNYWATPVFGCFTTEEHFGNFCLLRRWVRYWWMTECVVTCMYPQLCPCSALCKLRANSIARFQILTHCSLITSFSPLLAVWHNVSSSASYRLPLALSCFTVIHPLYCSHPTCSFCTFFFVPSLSVTSLSSVSVQNSALHLM
jgi:hypothetical protein